jgi:pilus assembly protein CpaE
MGQTLATPAPAPPVVAGGARMTKAKAYSQAAGGEGAPPIVRAFVRDQEAEAVIRNCLRTLGVTDAAFTAGGLSAAAATLAYEPAPKLLILDISGREDALQELRSVAEVCDPSVSVIAIGDRNDISLYRDLKNAGINDYFFQPIQRESFAVACKSVLFSSEAAPADRKTGKLIYVVGVRGGVGATTIATTLAWSLAETKRRHTVLMDLGLRTGDAALQLDATPDRALYDALAHPDRVDKLLLERGLKRITSRLGLFASLEPLEAAFPASEEGFLWLMSNLLPRYSFTIVDAPKSVAMKMAWAFRIPSACILVTNPTLSGARDLARWSEMIGPDTPERQTLHVVNHVTPHGALKEQEFLRVLGRPVDAVIPYCRELAEASSLGIAATMKCRSFLKSLAPIRRNFSGEAKETGGGLFSRLFRKNRRLDNDASARPT